MREALAFLTVLPAGAPHRPPGRVVLVAFPVVGLTLGGVWAGVAWVSNRVWGPLAAAAWVLAVDLLLTGGFHLDALADAVDGLASRRRGPAGLAIMRDPAVGGVGAAALGTALLLRLSLLAALVAEHRWWPMMGVPVAGRVAMVWAMARSPIPPEGSLASSLVEHASLPVGGAVGALGCGLGFLTGGGRGLFGVVAAMAVAEAVAQLGRRRFGQITGDVLGASGLAGEVAALATLASL